MMCGHFGVITSYNNGFTSKEVTCFKLLGYLDTLRGEDATSFTSVTSDGNVHILKESSIYHDFVKDIKVPIFLGEAISKGKALLGHNRKATVGGVKDEHAHPFVIDDKYVFNHNGKLYNHEKHAKTEVDSEALGQLLCPAGSDVEKLGEVLGDISASMAVVWYDMEQHQVKFLRNSERPLYYARDSLQTFYYASERWMLEALSSNQDIKLTISQFSINTLYTLDLEEKNCPLTEEEIKIKKAPPPSTHTGATTTHHTGRTIKSGGRLKGSHMGTRPPFLSDAAYDVCDIYSLNEISKNSFKREQRKLLEHEVVVWVDDIVPGHEDKTPTFVIFCGHEDFPGWAFTFRVHNKTYEDVSKYEGRQVKGRVKMCTYDRSIMKGIATLGSNWEVIPLSLTSNMEKPHDNDSIVQH